MKQEARNLLDSLVKLRRGNNQVNFLPDPELGNLFQETDGTEQSGLLLGPDYLHRTRYRRHRFERGKILEPLSLLSPRPCTNLPS